MGVRKGWMLERVEMKCVGFIGAGNMARALGGGLPTETFDLIAIDPDAGARERFVAETGGTGLESLEELVARANVIVLSVKPQVINAVLPNLAAHVRPEQRVISIVAGVTLKGLVRSLGPGVRTVRAMPNTPALVREGMTVLVGGDAALPEDLTEAEEIFAAVGRVAIVDDESLMDGVTALSGSGPGFLFAFAEALLAGAEQVGMPRDLAVQLVQQTLYGAAALWRESGDDAGTLRQRVTSPGGTTQAGLEALEGRGFAGAVRSAIEAATRRSRDLAAG